jgi:hypothetical protein
MLHAARASAPRAAAPPSPRQFLIDTSAIKIVRNSPENNALNFSNRSKIACLPAPFAHVLRSRNHDSPVTYHGSRFTNHQSLLTKRAFLIATQILETDLTPSQQTRKHFLIATFYGSLVQASNSATRVSIAESSVAAAKYLSQFTSGKPMRVAWAGSCSRSSLAWRPGNSVRASKTTRCSGSCQRCVRSCARMAVRAAVRAAESSMQGDGLLQSARRILDSRPRLNTGTSEKEDCWGIPMGTPRTCNGSLCRAGNYRPDEVNAVNSYRDAEDRRDFTRQWRDAQSFGAGTDQDGRATLALRRKRKSKFQTRAGFDSNIRVEKDPGTGDVSQLPGVELQRAVLGHTNLYG